MALVGGVSSRGDTLSPRNFFFPSFLSFFFFFICVFFSLFSLSLSSSSSFNDGGKKITRYVYRGERGARIHLANLFRRQA